MSYVPPHKRHSNRNATPTPVPTSLNPKQKNPSNPNNNPKPFPSKIAYSSRLISRWYATSSTAEPLALVPCDAEVLERRNGPKPLTLAVANAEGAGGGGGGEEEEERGVVRGIVEKVARDLIEAGQYAREEREKGNGDVKLLVMARVGKVLFFGDPSVCLDSIKKASASGELNRLAQKLFHTKVSDEYIREVEELLVEKCGFRFDGMKERYHVKVMDKCHDSIISCKCTSSHDGILELYKVEHNPLRHMVTDVSSLSKNNDFRVMLNTKRAVKNMDPDVANGIDQLIAAAVKDPEVKGGLRWPLGKESAADRFVVVGVWHIKYKILYKDKIRAYIRQADRFDYHSSTGEDANEVSFKHYGLSEQLTEDNISEGSLVDMIQEVVGLIWENLLSLSSARI